MIPYQSITINGVSEQCFVIEVIGTTQYVIQQKYILGDSTLSADVEALNSSLGAFPKTGGVNASKTFEASNGSIFYSKYSGLIARVSNVVVAPSGGSSSSGVASTVAIDQSTVGYTDSVTIKALPVGSNVIGKMTIDQTTPGTTDSVSVKSIAAGANVIGKMTIDQTTPGTTNATSLSQIGATTVATGNGVVGAGVQRVAISSDNSPHPIKIDQTTPGTTDAVTVKATGIHAPVSPTNISGTITAGGTAQALSASNATRRVGGYVITVHQILCGCLI